MKCSKCGTELSDDVQVCPECGATTIAGIRAAVVPATNQTIPVAVPVQTTKSPGLNKQTTTIIAVAAIAFLAIAGFFIARQVFTPQNIVTPSAGISQTSAGVSAGDSAALTGQEASGIQAGQTQDAQPETPQLVVVPDLAGLTESAARAKLEEVGLVAGEVTTEKSETVEEGAVVSQGAAPGSEIDRGSACTLVISSGKPEHRYEYVSGVMSWTDAQNIAESRGGYLACVTSQEEWDKVKSVIPAEAQVIWLGGYRDADKGFVWQSGESFSFSPWARSEPNNENNNENRLGSIYFEGSWQWFDMPNSVEGIYKASIVGAVVEYVG